MSSTLKHVGNYWIDHGSIRTLSVRTEPALDPIDPVHRSFGFDPDNEIHRHDDNQL